MGAATDPPNFPAEEARFEGRNPGIEHNSHGVIVRQTWEIICKMAKTEETSIRADPSDLLDLITESGSATSAA